MAQQIGNRFEQAAATETDRGTLRELWSFLGSNKRWWMAPIIVVLLMFGILIFLSGTAVAPFIYTLF
jgi:hypothetical protein